MTKAPPATPLRDLEVRRRTISLHGREVSFLGAGTGPVLLLIHGIASDAETWRTALPLLARRFTVIAPDLPGHGQSDKAPGDYSLGAMASTMRDLLVTLGHERATLAGHSLGGGIAMQFTCMYPDRCVRLALVSSGGLGREVSWLLRAATLPGAEIAIGMTVTPLAAAGRQLGHALRRVGLQTIPDLGEVGRGFSSLADRDGRAAFLATLRSSVDAGGQTINASERLYLASELPTLLIWGDHDPIIPLRHGREAAEMMVGSELRVFPHAGHFPHLDDPHRFADAILEFATTTKSARMTPKRFSELLRGTPGPGHAREQQELG